MGKPGHTGLKRIVCAAGYSLKGFSWALRKEAAFRQELLLVVVLTPVAFMLGKTGVERALMIGSLLLVVVVELLNSAIEAVVDRIGDGEHPLAGAAKDMGSAAVLVSLVLAAVVWGLVVWG